MPYQYTRGWTAFPLFPVDSHSGVGVVTCTHVARTGAAQGPDGVRKGWVPSVPRVTTVPLSSTPWRRRGLGALVAVVLVAAGAVGGWWWSSRAVASPTAGATTSSQLVAASLGTVKQNVSASGTLEPASQATASFTSSGTVTAVDVEVGETVTKGQVLATIDDSDLQDAVTLAEAAVTAAQDQVDSASTTEALASAKAQRATARSQLADAQAALDGATLRATMSGTVASVGLAVGDSTGSGSGSGSGGSGAAASGGASTGTSTGTTAATSSTGIQVVNTSRWVVEASVSSGDLGELKKGLQATIVPTGATQNVFGTVKSVGVVASSSSSGTSAFPVVIDVTGTPEGLHAGTTATVAITVEQLTDVLTVPTQSVHTTNGATTVQLSTNGTVTTTPVTVGGVYGTSTVITKGLSEGDTVVVTTRTLPRTSTGTSGGSTRQGQGGFPGGGFPDGGAPPAGGPPVGVGP
jgi:multidrug efflux pump subunit AcrA (membrane-fusion protein)